MKKISFVNLMSVFIIFATMSSCMSVKVTTQFDKSVDFTKYKTLEYYGWEEGSDRVLNPFDKKTIEQSFANEFRRRGIEVVESGGDIIVALFIVLEKKTQTTAQTNYAGGYYGGFYGYGPGWGWGPEFTTTTISTFDYLVGTLVCDVFDKQNEKLLWEGILTKTIDENPETRDKNIPVAVEKLMRYYPVPPLKEKK